MDYVWYKPRIKIGSKEPRIRIGKKYISLNLACVESFFSESEYVRIGYNEQSKQLMLVPVNKDDAYKMKIIKNEKSNQRYINAGNFLFLNGLSSEHKRTFACQWDKGNKGILINLKTDLIKN